jgi:hypothetical protein
VVAEIIKKTSEKISKSMFVVAKLTSIKIEVINIRAKNVAGFFIWFVLIVI